MTALLLHVLSMSLTASVVILAVLLARIPLRRAPKKISYWLWLAVAFRLCCPVSWNSPFSLFSVVPVQMDTAVVLPAEETEAILPEPVPEDRPSPASPALPAPAEEVTEDPAAPAPADTIAAPVDPVKLSEQRPAASEPATEPAVPPSEPVSDPVSDPVTSSVSDPDPGMTPDPIPETPAVTQPAEPDPLTASADTPAVTTVPQEEPVPEEPAIHENAPRTLLSRILDAAAVVWLCGIGIMLVYAAVSYLNVRRAMATAIRLEDGVYESDRIRSPFLLGVVRPKIYLPLGVSGDMLRYVLAHERYHIRRGDSAVKLFAFLLLGVHWFNPLVWLAFALMTRDMEMSCDEYVLSTEPDIRKRYSYSLLSFASGRQLPSPSPLSFGEGDVKSRIKNVLGWKRPKRWVTAVAIVLAAAAAIFCMANPMEKKTPDKAENTQDAESADSSVRSLVVLPEGDWTTRTADAEELLFSSGGWMDSALYPDRYADTFWNGWYKENGLFCDTSLRFIPGDEMSFRWLGSRGEVSDDYRGSYVIREDGTVQASFSAFDEETLSVYGPSYEAVFSLRADAGHPYGTEYRETVGVTLVSTDCPDFEALVGVELGMTGAAWFRGDLDGNPADAIVKLTSTDKTDADFASLSVYETKAEEYAMAECLTVLYPDSYDTDGEFRIDSEADPAPDAVLVTVTDLGDLCFYAENVGRQNGGERDSFRLKAFRWRGEWTALARPMWFTPNWFHLYRAEQAAFFFVQAPSGQDADMTYVLLTEDGAFCFDSTEAEAGYLLDLRADAAGMLRYGRVNADFLNLQTVEDHLRFRGREEDPYTENGTLRYENGRFVFTPETRQTPSEWFEAQKKTYPTSYPEETFGTMSLREYVRDWLPKYLRDERLHEKGLFTPEEAESVTRYMVERMMTEDWLKEDFAFDAKQASGFCFMIGTMKANAGQIPVPESLTLLWNNEWEGIGREDAYRIAAQMFGLNPEDPSALASPSFVYDEAQDSYRVALFTGLSHGYYDMEDVSVVWDYASVTVRFRLVAYQPGPEDSGGYAGVYADERIDFGEYRMVFHKPDGLDTQGLPRILFAKRGEIEAADSPEPPLSDELKNSIIYPDFFDDEQRDLYARATVFLPAVWGPTASYVEDFAPRKDGEPFLNGYNYPSVTVYDPERGLDCRYFVCHGRYENWADLDAAGRSLFTGELWESITGPGKRCMEFGGKTLFLDADAGSSGYDPTLDRFELVEKTEEKITYWFITSYRERGTLAVESSERTLITLVKTDLGWRFASFRQGDWIPAGTDAPERVSCYSEDYAEFIVRDIVRHVMDDSWLDGKTAYSALDAVRFVNTMPLWGYPYRVAEPSEDGMIVRILNTFCAEAVQNLFGIDNFDYFAAAREVFGDDASLSTERSEDGWIVWPTDMGELTTKFDIAGILAVSDEASTRVYVHLVNATDYPWDEADYGTFLFTFTPDFEGPALHVERIAHTSTRAEVERKIAELDFQRKVATNDMNNASARIAEYDEEIARLRAILEDDSALIEDQITAMQRLGDAEKLREQQIALTERCRNVIGQFEAEIAWYEAVLAEMRALGIGILPEETVRGLYADLLAARYADAYYQPYAAEFCDLDGDGVRELIVFRTPTESTLPLDIYCIEDGEVRAFLSPFDVKKSEGAPDDDVALASLPADYAQADKLYGFFRMEDGTVVLGAGIASEFYFSCEYYQFASMGGALRMRELFSAEWAGEWYFDEAKRNRTFVNGEEIAGGQEAYDAAVSAWIAEFTATHGPAELLASDPADRWNGYDGDDGTPIERAIRWLRGNEQAETDALHAKGLFSRLETALVAEQLITLTMKPEWLTDGDFRSAAGIFKLFGISESRYGSDYPAAFRDMIHESNGGYAISTWNLK
nr:hypothetical protein [Clostridiales bacterium]